MRPAETSQDLQHLVSLQNGEQSVEQDLESDGQRLTPVQDERCDVERYVGLHRLNRGLTEHVTEPKLVQSVGDPAVVASVTVPEVHLARGEAVTRTGGNCAADARTDSGSQAVARRVCGV